MSRKTGAQRHTHKYFLANGVWTCALPDCTHYMPLNVAHQVVGKRSLCWTCEEEIILTPDIMSEDKPRCEKCQGELDTIDEVLRQKGLL